MSSGTIKKIRKSLKLTQRAAAALVRVSPNTWARWERGESKPRGLHQKRAIASLPRLVTSPERPNPPKLKSARQISGAPSKAWSTGATWLKYAGTWVGDDAERCLKLVHATRGLAKF
jgi:transcriptional regulator with XRE-family HTH domain